MSRHVALLIEDDADTAAELVKLLRSIDHDCVHAATIEEARRFLEGAAFCYLVVDQQMVAAPGDSAEVATGMAFLRHARRCYPGMNERHERTVQILAMSAHLKTAGDGAKVVKYGANEFLEKPFGGDAFLRVVEEMLANAGRAAHDERCAAATAGARAHAEIASVPPAPGTRLLEITGEYEDGRTVILLDGTRVPLKGSSLFIAVRLVLERLRDRNRWVPVDQLGGRAGNGFSGISRLDAELRDRISRPCFHENSPGVGWRLSWGIEVGDIDLAALDAHPEPKVKDLAPEIRRRLRAPAAIAAPAKAKSPSRPRKR